MKIEIMNIYIASTSPRRIAILKELLTHFNIQFSIIEPDFIETQNGYSAIDIATFNARGKLNSISHKVDTDSVIIGADTVVCINGHIIGKPANNIEAKEYLRRLAGRSHSVFTGVALLNKSSNTITEGVEETIVTFDSMTDKDIEWYLSTSEPLDKAGGYAIQGIGEIFVKKIEGCYSNVVGLPKKLTLNLLRQSGAFRNV